MVRLGCCNQRVHNDFGCAILRCFISDINRDTNRERFWKKMTLGLWGFNHTNPQTVKAKKEEIMYKNLQFNIQTQTSFPFDEELSEHLKDYLEEVPLDDEETPSSKEKNASAETSENKEGVAQHNFRQGVGSQHSSISKSSGRMLEPKHVTEEMPRFKHFPEIYKVNAETPKHMYTDTVTHPSVFEHKPQGEAVTSIYSKAYDDPGTSVISEDQETLKENVKDKFLVTSPRNFKKSEESTKINRAHKPQENKGQNNNVKKLNDFGPFAAENMPGHNIQSQQTWRQWFSGFLPKEQDIGRRYQQELLNRMFPNEAPHVTSSLRESETSAPTLRTADKTRKPPGRSDDYVPPEMDTWQSFTPSYSDAHRPLHPPAAVAHQMRARPHGEYSSVAPGHRRVPPRPQRARHHSPQRSVVYFTATSNPCVPILRFLAIFAQAVPLNLFIPDT